MQVRGLKHDLPLGLERQGVESHPVRVRGLKHVVEYENPQKELSRTRAVRELKLVAAGYHNRQR